MKKMVTFYAYTNVVTSQIVVTNSDTWAVREDTYIHTQIYLVIYTHSLTHSLSHIHTYIHIHTYLQAIEEKDEVR